MKSIQQGEVTEVSERSEGLKERKNVSPKRLSRKIKKLTTDIQRATRALDDTRCDYQPSLKECRSLFEMTQDLSQTVKQIVSPMGDAAIDEVIQGKVSIANPIDVILASEQKQAEYNQFPTGTSARIASAK